jgi:ATP synthase protein I
MAGENEAPKFEDFDARMRRLRGAAGLGPDEPEPPAGRASIGGTGVQVGIELVAGVFGGALIGYGLDRWLGTWPVLFLVMFFLGAAAGMLNAYRYIRRLSDAPVERPKDR